MFAFKDEGCCDQWFVLSDDYKGETWRCPYSARRVKLPDNVIKFRELSETDWLAIDDPRVLLHFFWYAYLKGAERKLDLFYQVIYPKRTFWQRVQRRLRQITKRVRR